MEPFPVIPETAKTPIQKSQQISSNGPPPKKEKFAPVFDKAISRNEPAEKEEQVSEDAGALLVDGNQGTTSAQNFDKDTTACGNGDFREELLNPKSRSAQVPSLADIPQQQKMQPEQPFPEKIAEDKTSLIFSPFTREALPSERNSVSLPQADKSQTILLKQIQQIIDEGKNTGAMVINSKSGQQFSPAEGINHLQTLTSPILTASEDSYFRASIISQTQAIDEPQTDKIMARNILPEAGRQDITEQFLNAKLKNSNKEQYEDGPGQQNSKGRESGNSNTAQQSNTVLATSFMTGDSTLQENLFGQQPGLLVTPGSLSPIGIHGSTAGLEMKSAHGFTGIVPESEVVNTLLQRFSSNPRLQTSKLTMQIHPAELGELKVDIAVKENSISANIIVQNQQVLETIEKNMVRLRTVLENQGFSIDNLAVSIDSGSGSGKQMFQEEFETRNQQFSKTANKNGSNGIESFGTILDGQEHLNIETGGVNIAV